MKLQQLCSYILGGLLFVIMELALAGSPLWTFTPLTSTTISVPANTSATIQYIITNQSNRAHTLVMTPIQGVVQITIGNGVCPNPFTLSTKGSSCILSLQAIGNQLIHPINNGPIVCQQGSNNECYRPSAVDILHITQT